MFGYNKYFIEYDYNIFAKSYNTYEFLAECIVILGHPYILGDMSKMAHD